jgi:hypothetical protein
MEMTPRDWDDMLAREHHGRADFMQDAFLMLAFNGISGDYAEFGCHGAVTFRLAHRNSRRYGRRDHLWAFDSFEGLPPGTGDADAHPQWDAGKMATGEAAFRALCAEDGMAESDYTTVKGFFSESLPALGADGPADIALAYIDCDLYSSTADVHAFLGPRLKHGMVLAYDDYFCFSPEQPSGERRAHLEFAQEHADRWTFVPYGRFAFAGQAFVVERRIVTGP